jgi:hypothetical protein
MGDRATMPFYQSKVIMGSIVSVLCFLAVATGLVDEVSDADEEQLTNIAVGAAGVIAQLVAIIARLRQRSAPAITVKPNAPYSLGALLLLPMLMGCATVPAGAPTLAAVVFEAGVRARCPASDLEVAALLGARMAFDVGFDGKLSPEQQAQVETARVETNRFCGLVAAQPAGGQPRRSSGTSA